MEVVLVHITVFLLGNSAWPHSYRFLPTLTVTVKLLDFAHMHAIYQLKGPVSNMATNVIGAAYG